MIDLHCHTTASDGSDSAAGLIATARSAGLTAIAITDHDTLAGFDEGEASARDAGLTLIPAVELSVRGAHLLGYFPAGVQPGFREWLETLKVRRRARNAAIASNLRRLGCEVTVEEAEALGRNITGRGHFARVLIQKGQVRDWEDAFARYLGEHAPAYVEREDPYPDEGIERLRGAGAVVSLAHPVRLRQADPGRFLGELVRWGLQAIEVWHSDHSDADAARYLSLASRFGLASTAGSDYHGLFKPEVELGAGRRGNIRGKGSLDDLHRALAYS